MIKLILFDLDGVLVNTKNIHFDALNEALGERAVTRDQHLSLYDGMTTMNKLGLMGFSESESKKIFYKKQLYTYRRLDSIESNDDIIDLFLELKKEGYEIGICSNAIKKTVAKCLSRVGITHLCDFYLCSGDVVNPKPHPEIY